MARKELVSIVGNVYGFVKVLYKNPTGPSYMCLCECGREFTTTKQRLEGGRTKSCGCKKSQLLKESLKKHGACSEIGTMMGFRDMGTYRQPNLMVKRYLMKVLGWTYD